MDKLIVPWSENMSFSEESYKSKGFTKTASSIFTIPEPSKESLILSFNRVKQSSNLTKSSNRVEQSLSVGAIALASHANRSPYYPAITGNNSDKNQIASEYLDQFLKGDLVWKNIHNVNNNVIYELRNRDMYGMRWYIRPDGIEFRGLLEPYSTYLEYKKK